MLDVKPDGIEKKNMQLEISGISLTSASQLIEKASSTNRDISGK